MTTAILLIIIGLGALYAGGEGLVRGSTSLALRLGISPLVAGLTVVAFGTSTPELVTNIQAGLQGRGDIAAGNVIGACALNIGVILGLTALITPLRVGLQLLKFDAPVMVAVVCLPFWFLHDRVVTRVEAGILTVLFLSYTGFIVVAALRAKVTARVERQFDKSTEMAKGSPLRDLAYVAGGLLLLGIGSDWLIRGAVLVAQRFGVSEAVIGLTVVSLGTTTPELTSCTIAALRKQPDIALGNLIGSNIFNVLAIFGISGLVRPISAPGLGNVDIAAMVALSAAMLPMIFTGKKLTRVEGFVLLAGYGSYVWWLWPK